MYTPDAPLAYEAVAVPLLAQALEQEQEQMLEQEEEQAQTMMRRVALGLKLDKLVVWRVCCCSCQQATKGMVHIQQNVPNSW